MNISSIASAAQAQAPKPVEPARQDEDSTAVKEAAPNEEAVKLGGSLAAQSSAAPEATTESAPPQAASEISVEA
jgi:hypothetical protein